MKKVIPKVIVGIVLGALMVMTPMVVGAESCCDCEGCCKEMCCAEITYWYRVSYFERVSTGYFFHGVEMTKGVWTYQYVEAHDHGEAAELLGMEAGYGCFVSRVV